MKLVSIQYLRALAVWIVVFHHFVQVNIGFSTTNNGLELFFTNYGSLGVDLFFIISGFVISLTVVNKNETLYAFLKKRAFRIVPNYWFYTLLLLGLVLMIKGFYGYNSVDYMFVLKSMFFVPEKSPIYNGFYPFLSVGWTLNYEVYFYLLFAIVIAFVKTFEKRILLLLVAMIVITNALGVFAGESFYASAIVFEFLLGVIGSYVYKRGWLDNVNPLIPIFVLTVSMLFIYFRNPGHDYLFTGVPMLFILMSAVSLEKYTKESWVSRLGDYSYSTYLAHAIIWVGLKLVCDAYLIDAYWILPIGVLMTYLMSVLTFEMIEKKLYFNLKSRGLF